jgi:uracil-DNA glycosylase
MNQLNKDIKSCKVCSSHFEHEPNPVFDYSTHSKIVVIGQAPGSVVHRTGVPWDDKSGDNLRKWLDVDKATFYDVDNFAIIPMGFCYPGKGKSGDLPPRKECAPLWHNLIFSQLDNVKLTLLIGKYAQDYYLKNKSKKNLTTTVESYVEYLPQYFVLPHPSPRNNIWMKKNSWFKTEVLPELKSIVQEILR